jgi:membrane-associated phospholipid phosphatase
VPPRVGYTGWVARIRQHGQPDPPPPPEAQVAARGTAGVLVAGAVSVAGALLLLAAEGRWDPVEDLDVSVAGSLHDAVRGHPGAIRALEVIASVFEPGVFRVAVAAVAIALWVRGWRRLAAWCATVTAVGGLVGVAMKYVVARARPVLPDPVAAAPGYSFPSGHALNSVLCLGVLLVVAAVVRPGSARRLAAPAALVAGLIGFDRLALGVHYTSDVLAGWCTAAAIVFGALAAVHPDRLRAGRTAPAEAPGG